MDGVPGKKGVRVSLQCRKRLDQSSRQLRKDALQDTFGRLAQKVEHAGVTLNLDSISTTGQTVEAILPLDEYDRLVAQFERDGFRVDPIVLRKVLDDEE